MAHSDDDTEQRMIAVVQATDAVICAVAQALPRAPVAVRVAVLARALGIVAFPADDQGELLEAARQVASGMVQQLNLLDDRSPV